MKRLGVLLDKRNRGDVPGMTTIVATVLQALRTPTTVQDVARYTGITERQVRSAIERIDLTHEIARYDTLLKVTKRRDVPKKRGVKRHDMQDTDR